MKRVAIYSRVSTSGQDTEPQIFALRQSAERNNANVVVEFTDTISGAVDARPGLDACLIAARKNKFDVLYVYSIDRLGRSTKQLISVVELLQDLRIDIMFLRENIDTTSPTGKCVFTIMASIATLEREIIKSRVVAGIDKARRNGVRLGRPTVMNDSMVTAIRLLRQKGMTVRSISTQLKCGVGTVYKVIKNDDASLERIAA